MLQSRNQLLFRNPTILVLFIIILKLIDITVVFLVLVYYWIIIIEYLIVFFDSIDFKNKSTIS